LAKSEDVSGYAAEREDQAAVIDRGEEIPGARQGEWYRRASKALQEATLEAQGIQPNSQQPQGQPTYIPDAAGYESESQSQDPDYARKEGAAQVRIQNYFGNDTEKKQNIVDWHQAMDPQCTAAD
jgi:hypothetical protein